MLEFLLEVLGEFVLQLVLEIGVEIGLHSLRESFRRSPNKWWSAGVYALSGAMVGGISIWPFPHNLIADPTLRIVNLVVTPVAVGLIMSAVGARRAQRGQQVMRIDRFACGYLFALSMALVRYFAAR